MQLFLFLYMPYNQLFTKHQSIQYIFNIQRFDITEVLVIYFTNFV